jgi:dimethylargininase
LTHLAREPIDVARAAGQHREYERALESLGCSVVRAEAEPEHPDAVFVEYTAIVAGQLAVLTRPGAASRRGEVDSVAKVLSRYRRLAYLEAPATLDGGDVLFHGGVLYVGRSGRTNDDALAQLARLAAPFGISVVPVAITGCLHLKSAVTAVGDRLLLANPSWLDLGQFPDCDVVEVDPAEPGAANALRIGDRVVCAAAFPRTRERLVRAGLDPVVIDVSELAKAEGALTCCSIVFEA